MNLNDLHRRLLQDVLEIGNAFPLVLVVDGLTGRGWRVEVIGVDPHGARMMATDQDSGEQCELDILREIFSRPPETTPYGPVLAYREISWTGGTTPRGGGGCGHSL
jgi:hypothetical protein